jgi:hypothetical protein
MARYPILGEYFLNPITMTRRAAELRVLKMLGVRK